MEKPSLTVVGVGALGSHFALFARNLAVRFTFIDFDFVEGKNLHAQFYNQLDWRKNKARSLAGLMNAHYNLDTKALGVKLDMNNIEALLDPADIIVDCTDNFHARTLIKQYAVYRPKKPSATIHGCLSADGTLARLVWVDHFQPDREGADSAATCIDGHHLPFYAMAAAWLVHIVDLYLTGGMQQSWQLTSHGHFTRLV